MQFAPTVLASPRTACLFSKCMYAFRLRACSKPNAFDGRRMLASESGYSTAGAVAGSSIDQADQAQFRKLANQWWDETGPMMPLLAMNRLRVPFVREAYLSTLHGDESKEKRVTLTNSAQPLAGAQICDIGCGGGFLSEPLARLGARVTGIDVVEESISVAKVHAATQADLSHTPEYLCMPVEELAVQRNEQYDLVVASEVLEHVASVESFLDAMVKLTKPGGAVVITTINRTWLSYAVAIIGAEYITNVVPRGTHQWNKFIEPSVLEQQLQQRNCAVRKKIGMRYNPMSRRWSWCSFDGVNYAVSAMKSNSSHR